MAEKPKGNIFYEILIVVLIVLLIATILYPARVWKSEDELQNICRTRMETINEMELRYYPKANTYTDSIPALINQTLSDPKVVAALDTIVFWDGLIVRKDLKQLILTRPFPEELRNYIQEKFAQDSPLENLMAWDSLEYRLLARFKNVIEASDTSESVRYSMDRGIHWVTLLGENAFLNVFESSEVPRGIRSVTLSEIRRGKPAFETQGWKQYRHSFYALLQKYLNMATREDVWKETDEDRWEKVKRDQWEAEMDARPAEVRDSLWQELKQRFWEKEKELVWKKERNRLWKKEGENWQEANVALWKRVVQQKWASDRKSEWEEEQKGQKLIDLYRSASDSMAVVPEGASQESEAPVDTLAKAQEFFKAKRDSLWRNIVDNLRDKEYDTWERKNEKYVNEVIRTLWEGDRRVSWDSDAQRSWFEMKEANKDALWKAIKEELWNTERIPLWGKEQIKVTEKSNAQKRLDEAVSWRTVLGEDFIEDLVNQLQLPDSQALWKQIEKGMNGKESILNKLGIVGLFREILLDSIDKCPLAHTPYRIQVRNVAAGSYVGIQCPIVDTTKVKMAINVDPATKDTTEIVLKLPITQRIFGGGSIQNHGNINIEEEGKKSWERKRR